MTGRDKPLNALRAAAKVLCVIGGVCCLGIVLGVAGAVDVAGPRPVSGWVLQIALGLGGMAAFVAVGELID
jgi:hypothetical protein